MSGAGTVVGEIIDTAGYEAVEIIFGATEVNFGTIPISLFESDDPGMAGATQVSASEQLGAPELSSVELFVRVGYIGKKRYIRPTLYAGIVIATRVFGLAMLVNSIHQPASEQPIS